MSKEYAKLRKEQSRKHPAKTPGVVTVAPLYVLPETPLTLTTRHRGPMTSGTTRHFSGVAFNTSTMQPDKVNSSIPRQPETEATKDSEVEKYADDLFGLLGFLFNDDDPDDTTTKQTPSNDTTSESMTTQEVPTTVTPLEYNSTATEMAMTTTEEEITSTVIPSNITVTVTVLKSTECLNSLDSPESMDTESTTVVPADADAVNTLAYADDSTTELESTTLEATTTTARLPVKEEAVTVRSTPNVRSDMEEILNITKHKNEEFDYDYHEPSLPPSLPNVR